MADILCVVCNRVNDERAERCWYCQAVLPKAAHGTENEELNGLSDLRKDAVIENGDQQVPGNPDQPEGEIPDWLARIRMREQAERENLPENESNEGEKENEDWLSQLMADSTSLEQQVETDNLQEETVHKQHEILDSKVQNRNQDDSISWLQDLPGWNPQPDEDSALKGSDLAPKGFTQESVEKENEISNVEDLAGGIGKGEEEDPLEILNGSLDLDETPLMTDIPSIPRNDFSELDEQSLVIDNSETESLKDFVSDDGIQNEEIGAFSVNESIDALDTTLSTEENLELLQDTSSGESDLVLPDAESWLSGINQLSSETEQVSEDGEIKSSEDFPLKFAVDDLPDWLSAEESNLSSDTETKASVSNQDFIQENTEKLEKSTLPVWLKAVQPLEAVTSAEQVVEEQPQLEEEGLLAGIKGVLKGKNFSEQDRKPRAYASGLIATEPQLQNAELFKRLLSDTVTGSEFEFIPQKTQKKTGGILRMIVALVMLAAVFLPFIMTGVVEITPVLYPQEVAAMYSIIQNLPVEKPVLIAADFEAGLAGELNWIGQSVLVNMMARGLPLSVLSTNVIGSAVMEEQINLAATKVNGYLVEDRVVTFGYLPGGTIGLLSLARNLRQALPFTTQLQSPWQKSVLMNVNVISDFGAVIVFSDSAETARTWVEQVNPALGSAPMLLVVSAQAAPLVLPYYDSGQVDGYIAGLNGSLAYEQLSLTPGSSSVAFGSFQVAILLVALIIFLGGIYHFIMSSISSRKVEKGH